MARPHTIKGSPKIVARVICFLKVWDELLRPWEVILNFRTSIEYQKKFTTRLIAELTGYRIKRSKRNDRRMGFKYIGRWIELWCFSEK